MPAYVGACVRVYVRMCERGYLLVRVCCLCVFLRSYVRVLGRAFMS